MRKEKKADKLSSSEKKKKFTKLKFIAH